MFDQVEQNSSMGFLQRVQRMVQSSDMFCSSEMLRYGSQTQYKTLTGGIISICIIVFILTAFASMISDTINRLAITSSMQTIKRSNPSRSVLRTDEKNKFMFGISIKTNDLSSTIDINSRRYFDMMLGVGTTVNGMAASQQYVPLEKCTIDHWKMLPDVAERFDALQIDKWLCFPLNKEYPLQGAFSSTSNSGIVLYVNKCTNNPLFSQPCAPQSQIDLLIKDYSNFFFNMHFINPVISPSEPDHISYYLQSSDFLIFSKTMGACSYLQVSDYTINTDDSIWPLTNTVVQTGTIIQQKAIARPISISTLSPNYAAIFINKSINSLVYTREVQKISAVLSYIGGLVGAITAFLFMIKSYTGSSFQISIGFNLFGGQISTDHQGGKGDDDRAGISQKPSFNFFKYLGLTIYQILKQFGLRKQWKQIDRIHQIQNEAIYQLDVKTLLKRVIQLQLWMTYLFDDIQMEGLKHQKPLSFSKAKEIRNFISQGHKEIQTSYTLPQIDSQSKKEGTAVQIKQTEQNFITPNIFLNQIIHMSSSQDPQRKQKDQVLNTKKQGVNEIKDSGEKQSEPESDRDSQVPVEFLQNKENKDKLQMKFQKKKVAEQPNLNQQTLLCLRQLKILALQDQRSQKIWSNLKEDVQKIVAEKKGEQKQPLFFRRTETFN